VKIELARCKSSLKHWLINYCVTEDAQDLENPHKLFPRKEYLLTLADYWMKYKRLAIPKSRQMTASWALCAFYLWEAEFHLSRTTFFCSKKDQDADALCERTHFMYSKQPEFLRDYVKCDRTFNKLSFSNRSVIRGVPQGAEQTRGFTLSGLLIDEAVYVEELSPMLMASIPAIGQNGRITLVSSAGPSTFAEIVFDKI
jgi:hypothetical protein